MKTRTAARKRREKRLRARFDRHVEQVWRDLLASLGIPCRLPTSDQKWSSYRAFHGQPQSRALILWKE